MVLHVDVYVSHLAFSIIKHAYMTFTCTLTHRDNDCSDMIADLSINYTICAVVALFVQSNKNTLQNVMN